MNSNDVICCQQLPCEKAQRSPFGRLISLGFYDGTTSGVAQCSHCRMSYRYELVAWDSGQDTRIYSLASLPQGVFAGLVTMLSGIKGPTWPVWVPNWASGSAHDVAALEAALDAELAKAEPPSRVIASRQLEREILVGKELTSDARTKLPTDREHPDMKDWDFWGRYLAVDPLH